MKASGKKIVFFGNERIATAVTSTVPVLRSLLSNHYDVAAVVSNFRQGRSRNARELEIEKVARQHGIELLLPERLIDIGDQLRSYNASIAILVAYGRIVAQRIIDIFPEGIVNIHPSLLPLHRGPTPIEGVILNGEKNTGVSLMKLVKTMDAGPIYGQREVTLEGSEGKQEIADTLLGIGTSLLTELLPGILDHTIGPMAQDETRATYDKLLTNNDGVLDWRKAAWRLEREVRAYAGWPKSRTELVGREVIITEARVENRSGKPGEVIVEDKRLIVCCAEGSLEILRLKPAGKPEMPSAAFLAGYGRFLG